MTAPSPPPTQKKQINLLRGWPAPSLLPAPLLHHASSALLSDPSLYVPALQYGPDPGYQPLREALATWLGQSYGSPDTPDEICITGGASQAVACILQSFTDVGVTRGVWVVEPGYFLVGGMMRDAGLGGVVRGVREDGRGVDVGALGEGMSRVDEEWEGREAVYGKTKVGCPPPWCVQRLTPVTDLQTPPPHRPPQTLPPPHLPRPHPQQPLVHHPLPPPPPSPRRPRPQARRPPPLRRRLRLPPVAHHPLSYFW